MSTQAPIIAINDAGEQLWWDGKTWVPIEADPAAALTPTTPPRPVSAEEARATLTGPTERLVRGAAGYMFPSADTIGSVAKAAIEPPVKLNDRFPFDFRLAGGAKLFSDMVKGEGQRMSESADTATRRRAAGDTTGANIAAAGALPVVGAPIRDLAETGMAGDYAGLAGKMLGIGLPFLLGGKVGTPMQGAARHLEHSAGSNIIKAVGAQDRYVPMIRDNARAISGDIGAFQTQEQMLERLAGGGALSRAEQALAKVQGHPAGSRLGQAERELGDLKNATADYPIDPADMEAAAARLEGQPPRIRYDSDARGGPQSGHPASITAFEDEADRLRAVSRGNETVKEGTGPGYTYDIEDPETGAVRTETVPIEYDPQPTTVGQLSTHKTGTAERARAAGGYVNNPLVPESPIAKASKASAGVQERTIDAAVRAVDPVIADALGSANLTYANRRQLADILQASARKEVRQGASALGIMAARTGVKGALAATLGGGAALASGGGSAAALAGGATAYGLYKVLAEVMNSPRWNSLSAAQKLQVASALRSGAPIASRTGRVAGAAQALSAQPGVE